MYHSPEMAPCSCARWRARRAAAPRPGGEADHGRWRRRTAETRLLGCFSGNTFPGVPAETGGQSRWLVAAPPQVVGPPARIARVPASAGVRVADAESWSGSTGAWVRGARRPRTSSSASREFTREIDDFRRMTSVGASGSATRTGRRDSLDQFTIGAGDEEPIGEEAVNVGVEVEGAAEALDEGDRSRLRWQRDCIFGHYSLQSFRDGQVTHDDPSAPPPNSRRSDSASQAASRTLAASSNCSLASKRSSSAIISRARLK